MKSPFHLVHQNSEIDSRIVAALERISEAFRVLLWNESKEYALSPIQIQMLIFLLTHSEEQRKVSYLAQEFNMTKATISDALRVLEEKSLVKKTSDPNDSRSFVLDLTKKGKDIAEKTSFFTNELQTPINKLYSDDKENLLLSLMTIIHHLNKAGVITIQRMCLTCIHYETDSKNKHFCKLLNRKLETTDLRIDCPEHAQSAA
ncbi:winged helix-turn-helix transcriptional regulator [Sphingobacteriales bacterium CHB3]|nr:winged helix-turn-helix transcriptional regulator [Sphingobacteriales bacterium CHB3]